MDPVRFRVVDDCIYSSKDDKVVIAMGNAEGLCKWSLVRSELDNCVSTFKESKFGVQDNNPRHHSDNQYFIRCFGYHCEFI